MSVDSTFEFEKRRNRPVKYDRDLVTKTLGAMERVEEIKGKREERFYENRMKDRKTLVKKQKVAELEKGMELIVPAMADRDKVMAKVVERVKEKSQKMKDAKNVGIKVAKSKAVKKKGAKITTAEDMMEE
tara:strand:- start:335 stop:724 length:390 start_codon:yes stop_codon:yes gene_type:complete